ncbi:hypothetical protein C8J56DRAFT_899729 [Mycena floridula]|nr:hypothetical protein C8J56DRAFT_899729 [Mycena floridula]
MERTPPKSGRIKKPSGTLLTAPPTIEAGASIMQPSKSRPRSEIRRFMKTRLEPIVSLVDTGADEEEVVASQRAGLGSAFVTPVARRHSEAPVPPSVPSGRPSSRYTPASALSGVGSLRNLYTIPPSASASRPAPRPMLLPTTTSQFHQLFQPPLHSVQASPQSPKAPHYNRRVDSNMTEEERCIENDRKYPDFQAIQLNASTWPSTTKNLSYLTGNWTSWKRALDNVLSVNGQLQMHVSKAVAWTCPDPDLYPTSALNWHTNDQAVMGLIKSKVQPEEYQTTDDPKLDTAFKLLEALEKRHTRRGVFGQVKMLDEAFGIQFTWKDGRHFSDTIQRIQELNKSIWSGGVPDEDQFFIILLLRATQQHFPTLFDSINDSLSSPRPVSSEEIVLKIQNFIQSPHHKSTDSANVATVVSSGKSSTTSQSNATGSCKNCTARGIKFSRHIDKYCVLEGGGMAGKTVEEAKRQRLKDKDEREKKKNVANVAEEEANIAHFDLDTSPQETIFDARLVNVMTAADISEFETYICIERDVEVTPKVDWRHSQRDLTELAFEAMIPETIQLWSFNSHIQRSL